VPNSTYRVILKREARNNLHTLPSHITQQARQFIDTHLGHQPTQRILGKLKRLKGQLADVWQYDLPSGYRLWYRVNEHTQTVQVIYIGPHP
jgi:mRNA-degrading endonuclease RelE of RelBE toxin-antitoxin system